MPNTGRKNYEIIDDNESTETYIPLHRGESEDMARHDPDTEMGSTAGGKKLFLAKHPNNAGYYFKFEGGGQIPKELDGLWTNFHLARREAEVYLANHTTKVKDGSDRSVETLS